MTLEEKRKKIQEYCVSYIGKDGSCHDCPVFEAALESGGFCYSKGANIEKHYAILFGKEEDQNPYWERICNLSAKQRAKGMETYGQGLEANPADMLKRIEHLQEELIDSLYYLEWIKDGLNEIK